MWIRHVEQVVWQTKLATNLLRPLSSHFMLISWYGLWCRHRKSKQTKTKKVTSFIYFTWTQFTKSMKKIQLILTIHAHGIYNTAYTIRLGVRVWGAGNLGVNVVWVCEPVFPNLSHYSYTWPLKKLTHSYTWSSEMFFFFFFFFFSIFILLKTYTNIYRHTQTYMWQFLSLQSTFRHYHITKKIVVSYNFMTTFLQ